jgi:P-type Cu+ transporter
MSTRMQRPDGCDYCGLPLPRSWWPRSVEAELEGPAYCCFGCRLAASIVQERGEQGAARWSLTRLGLAVFFTMNVMAFTMALWTTDLYPAGDPDRLAGTLHALFRQLVLLFFLPVLFLLGWPLFNNAWQALRRGVLSTDLLLSAGVAAAVGYSAFSVIRGKGAIYFEVAAVVLVMVTLGRWLEATGKMKASDALDKLTRLLPERVRLLRGDVEEIVPLGAIASGDSLRVLPGERFPADGVLTKNLALVDEQVITGESRPVLKQSGDVVLGGTLNLDGELRMQVTATSSEGTLARLVDLVRAARRRKSDYERLADRVSVYFFPVIGAVALLSFGVHWWHSGLERGLLIALAVVLIACPCSLGLATPLAIWSALGRAAREQVLFRSGEALERLSKVKAIRFDKTGTLTSGQPRVSRFVCEDESEREKVLRCARVLASASSHTLSHAILQFTGQAGPTHPAGDARVLPGLGVTASDASSGMQIFLGSRRFLDEQGLRVGVRVEREARAAILNGCSVTFMGWGDEARGLFVFDEELRSSAHPALARCRAAGYNLGILTGDHTARGEVLSSELGIPVQSELLPEDKVAALECARKQFGPVAMVGDGINDAPALAASDVGIALGCGTDLSRDNAEVCLLGDDLTRLPWTLALARQTVRVIRWNLAWAFGYNSLGVLCAAFGLLNPALAALFMVASSALVISGSLSLSNWNEPKEAGAFDSASVDAAELPGSTRLAIVETPLPLAEAAAR